MTDRDGRTLQPAAAAHGTTPALAAAPTLHEPAAAGLTATGGSAALATATFNQNIVITQRSTGPGLLTRAVWYLLVGWWLTGFALTIAWLCTISVVLLPIAFMIVNRIPTLLTLRPRSLETTADVAADGTLHITTGGALQLPFWQRALWFVCVGWWAVGLAMLLAYALCLTLVLLPVGLMLFNRVPPS